ncbi:MAG: hypothetical protein JWR21_1162 [Herminiimonas sp.]|nr:hypothetical protein [Herminiimonas sp.]
MPQALSACRPQAGVTFCLRVADGFWARLRGLMWTSGPKPGEAMLLRHCASVHTCFVFAPLDLAYLDRDGIIVRLVPTLRPWRVSHCWHAAHTLELQGGAIAALGLSVGQRIMQSGEDGE